MICNGQSIAEVIAGCAKFAGDDTWARRMLYMVPKNVLELGTGQGACATLIMKYLHPEAIFTTINYNYPEGYGFGEQLNEWNSDKRLKRVVGDTTDQKTVAEVPDGVDLMFMDTAHEAWQAALELTMFQSKLTDGAIVIVDDLEHHDMSLFWESLPYDKVGGSTGQGFFRYDVKKLYATKFKRGHTAKELASGD